MSRIYFKHGLIILSLAAVPLFALNLPNTLVGDDVFNAISPQEDYDPKTLFDYINGGAEVYLDAGFEKCLTRRYGDKKKKVELVVNVYDMGTLMQAFGLFRHLHGSSEIITGVGAEGTLANRRFSFWKDKCYIEIIDKSTPLVDKGVLTSSAQAVAKLIQDEAVIPFELTWFPEPQKIKESERFYKSGFMGRKFLEDVLSCEYRADNYIYKLFILLPGADTDPSAVLQKMARVYTGQKKLSGTSRLKGLHLVYTDEVMAAVMGNLLIGVVGGADDEHYKAALIENCFKRITGN